MLRKQIAVPCQASYNGVLGGFGYVSDIDVRDSRLMLDKVVVWAGCWGVLRSPLAPYLSLAQHVSNALCPTTRVR